MVFKKLTDKKGALTVEAALVFPLFLCVILSIILFMQTYRTHEIIQHALDETSETLAETAYLWSGEEVQAMSQKVSDFMQITDNTATSEIANFLKEIAANQVGTIVSKKLMDPHIAGGDDLDGRLRKLGIVNGLNGLNFRKSTFLGQNEEIDIVVSYRIKIPLPIQLLGEIPIVQRSISRAWLNGGEIDVVANTSDEVSAQKNEILATAVADEVINVETSVWDLGSFARGKEIERLLGSNTHSNFPTVDKIEGRTITSITSHDTRAASNKGSGLYKNIIKSVDKLDEFKETTYAGTTISENDYDAKVLNIVLPDEPLCKEQIRGIFDAKEAARKKGIKIIITVVK